jgi:glycosyltransferase involved in cell wall biosynthesis
LKEYKGCRLKYIPLHANGIQSIPYDIWSLSKAVRGYDAILVLGISGCSCLPLFRLFCRTRLIVNIDGLEHRRAKWGRMARWILRFSEAMAVRYADAIIADNKGIQDYVSETYHKQATLIAYGGDHVYRQVPTAIQEKHLTSYGLTAGQYAITVCRIEPENNCHITLEAFARSDKQLVFIGNWDKSAYGRGLKEQYGHSPNIVLLDAIYDLDTLYSLRSNAEMYVHGHSAGGTNPSLVEAMFFGRPIVAYDVVYNRETTQNKAYYFSDAENLKSLLSRSDLDGTAMKKIAEKEYTWSRISEQYYSL